jgi:hypothetical protein
MNASRYLDNDDSSRSTRVKKRRRKYLRIYHHIQAFQILQTAFNQLLRKIAKSDHTDRSYGTRARTNAVLSINHHLLAAYLPTNLTFGFISRCHLHETTNHRSHPNGLAPNCAGILSADPQHVDIVSFLRPLLPLCFYPLTALIHLKASNIAGFIDISFVGCF